MNTRILTSVLTIVAVVTAVAGMTYAYFSDQVTSNDNIFRAGTLDLQIRDNNERLDGGFTEAVTASFETPANWAPGQTYTSFVCFKNNGSIPIQQILTRMTSPNGGTLNVDLDNWVYVSNIEMGPAITSGQCEQAGSESLASFISDFRTRFDLGEDLLLPGKVTLNELLTHMSGDDPKDDDLIDTPGAVLTPGMIGKLRITWTFDAGATNDVMGESITVHATFAGTQAEGQLVTY